LGIAPKKQMWAQNYLFSAISSFNIDSVDISERIFTKL